MTQSAAPCEYDSLNVMQKVEVFEAALKHTAGQDLYKVCVVSQLFHVYCTMRVLMGPPKVSRLFDDTISNTDN